MHNGAQQAHYAPAVSAPPAPAAVGHWWVRGVGHKVPSPTPPPFIGREASAASPATPPPAHTQPWDVCALLCHLHRKVGV